MARRGCSCMLCLPFRPPCQVMEGVRCGGAVMEGGPGGAGTWGRTCLTIEVVSPRRGPERHGYVQSSLKKASSVALLTQIGEAFQGRRGQLLKRDFTRSHRCLPWRWLPAREERSVWAPAQAPTANTLRGGCSTVRVPVHQRTR